MVHITIRDLSKRFAKQLVLNGINLEIPSGELFFLLGPSGCGKTTLLRHIAGFLQPDEGRIFFDDKDVTRMPAHRRGLGMMFQSYALWPHLNVAENVAFGLEERRRPRAEIEQRVAEMLELVKLGSYSARRISELSGGQQQRVALARSLVIQPRCLLLDEPLSNLDARLRQEMRAEIRRLCKGLGLTAIYVTHDRDEALSMADRVAIMDSGRLIQIGSPEEIYRQPASRMAAEFMGETNLIEGIVQGLSGREGFYSVQTTFGALHGRPNNIHWHPAQGERVAVSLRPETLTFGHVLGWSNHLPGHILETTYLGAMVQYLVQLYDGPVVKVWETNPQQVRQPSADSIRVMGAASDAVILPE